MDITQAFPSKYVTAGDLAGQDIPVIIGDCTIEVVDPDTQESRPVLYFQGQKKGLVLNKTNANAICSLLGTPETTQWAGRTIIIHPDSTSYKGEIKACIRVRPWLPSDAPQQPQQPQATQQPAQPPVQQTPQQPAPQQQPGQPGPIAF